MTATAEAPRIDPVFNPGDVVKLYAPGDPQHGVEMVVVDGTPDEGQITVEVDGAEFLVGLDKLTVVQRAEPGAVPPPAPAVAPAAEPAEPKRDRLGRVHRGGYPKGMPRDPAARAAWEREQAPVSRISHDLGQAQEAIHQREGAAREPRMAAVLRPGEPLSIEQSPLPPPPSAAALTDRELLRLIELAETTVHEPIRHAAMVILGRAV